LKYKHVELELRQLIRTLPLGAKFPPERELANEYGCNFLTVRKALKHLVADGLITRRTGSGTFISSKMPLLPSSAESGSNTGPKVGALIFQQGNSYSFAVLQAMARHAQAEGLALRSCWIADLGEAGLRQVEELIREGCNALVLPWFPHEMTVQVVEFTRRSPLPICLPMVIPGLEAHCFEARHLFGATIQAVTDGVLRYVAALGRSPIAFLGPDAPMDPILQLRLNAYARFASETALPLLPGLVAPGTTAMDQLAARWRQYQGDLGIIAYDDEHALRFMTAMHKLGLSAPRDFAIVGYNNTEASHFSDPPLTTVGQNFDYLGTWMIRAAIALAEGRSSQSTEAPSLDLLVRQSCGGLDRAQELARRLDDRPVNLRLVPATSLEPEPASLSI
jgi:DNA-binding LacI/PurR family transcriptional regulator